MSEAIKDQPRVLPYVSAITEAVQQVLKEQDNAFVAGEDVGQAGSVFGYYQGLLAEFGDRRIVDTPISLSMHPPKVDERGYIEFPESSDLTLNQLIDGHTAVVGEVNDLKETVSKLEQLDSGNEISYAGIGLGIIAIIIAGISLARSKK